MKTKVVALDVYGTMLPTEGEQIKRKGLDLFLEKCKSQDLILCTCSDANSNDVFLDFKEAGLDRNYFRWFFKIEREGKNFTQQPKNFMLMLHYYKRQNISPEEILVIGDRYERDFKSAQDSGCKAILVPEYKMKVIFIRGLFGTGKTAVAEILKQIFLDCEIICVDKFKFQAMKKGDSFEKSQEIAYERTLEKLNSVNKEYVIVEELIFDRNFYNKLKDFVNKTKSQDYWFRLLRPLEKLLEIEENRKRKIKNSKEDFDKFKKDVENCKIEGEYWIKNDELVLTIKKILDVVTSPKNL